jgi:hypothetical protein
VLEVKRVRRGQARAGCRSGIAPAGYQVTGLVLGHLPILMAGQ